MHDNQTILIRGYEPSDLAQITPLFYDSVHTVCARDYTPAELDAWASGSVDTSAWNASFLAHHSVVAVLDGAIVGFGDMDGGYLDRLYVHAAHQRQGIAGSMVRVLEEFARENGYSVLTVHASLTARGFFEHLGYSVFRAQQVSRGEETLTNFVMWK